MLSVFIIQTQAGYFEIGRKFASITFPPRFHKDIKSATPYSSVTMACHAIRKYKLKIINMPRALINGDGEIIEGD